MKKFFALFACVAILFAFTACGSIIEPGSEKNSVNDEPSSDYKNESNELPVSGVTKDYKFDEYSDHIVLTEYIGTKPSVFIPNMINGKPVTDFGTIFKGNLNTRIILIGQNCTEIVDGAFENCYNLQRVEIIGGVRSIGELAFFGCHSLKLIYIPACVELIAEDAFLYSTDLIVYGDKGSAIEKYADKFASIYFREYTDILEEQTLADIDEENPDESVTE